MPVEYGKALARFVVLFALPIALFLAAALDATLAIVRAAPMADPTTPSLNRYRLGA
jgi:hypothetical protein